MEHTIFAVDFIDLTLLKYYFTGLIIYNDIN
jgi:hypothetical protein